MIASQGMHSTGPDGTLTLSIPLGRPNAEYEVVVVVHPKATTNGTTTPVVDDPWAGANAIRERLAASGRVFGDSVELIREDRDR